MVLPTEAITLSAEMEILDVAELPTRTYRLDAVKGRCSGFIDRKEAMEQAIFKVINTVRFAHLIYSDDYGFEHMTGHERLFVRGDLPRRIKEALLQDERITSITNFTLDFEKDEAYVSLTADTIFGDVDVLREAVTIV